MNITMTDPHLMKSPRSLRSLFQHSFVLTKRSVLGRLRQPAIIAPSFIFPLFFAALGSASFHKLAEDPYFTKNIATSFLNYAIAGAVLQGVLFASTSAAADLAIDIEQGFFERLLASPISRTSIVLGRLAGSMVVAISRRWSAHQKWCIRSPRTRHRRGSTQPRNERDDGRFSDQKW